MKSKRYAFVNRESCVACGACTKECPRNSIEIFKGCFALIDEASCVGCGKCAQVCPVGSIKMRDREVRNG